MAKVKQTNDTLEPLLRFELISSLMILVPILRGSRNYTNHLPGCSKALRVAWSLEIKD